MEIQKYQYTQNFLYIVRGSKSKNQFLKMVQQFDQKFTQSHATTNMMNKQSLQSFQSRSQIDQHYDRSNNQFNALNMKPKNPFLKDHNDNNQQQFHHYKINRNLNKNYSPQNRGNNFINLQTQYNNTYFNQYNNHQNAIKMEIGKKTQNSNWNPNIQCSRSEQQFYKHQTPNNTYHGGFFQKTSDRNNNFTQINQSKLNNQWGQDKLMPNQGFNNYSYGSKTSQFQQLAKNFENMNLKDQHSINNIQNKLISPNEMPSFTNQYPFLSNNFENQNQNQFLANLQKQQEPDYIKYYKKLVPSTQSKNNLHKQNQGPVFIDHRSNPFAPKN